MNYVVDILILVCLGWGACKGFRKGFIIQSFVIIALILAVWGGFALSEYLDPFLREYFVASDLTRSILSFVVIFLVILILVYVSGYFVTKIADTAALGMINRIAGAIFGIFANALVLSVIIVMLNRINDKKEFIPKDKLAESYLYEPVGKVAPAIFPEKFFKKVKDTLM
jgi:membrane protein required for colicin V production